MKPNLKISKTLPQFEKFPALFIAAGEYEAKFYIALNGILELKEKIKMPPREEAKEKQGFVGKKGGMQSLSAVSHKGRYIEDLKNKFQKKTHAVLHDILAEYGRNRIQEIYVFAPRYAAKRIVAGLDKEEAKKIRMEFFQENTKINPLIMIRKFWKTEQAAARIPAPPEKSAKKILQKPKLK